MNIVVLAGGISSERDVSLVSGSLIYEALKNKGHNCILLDPFLGIEKDREDIFTADIDWSKGVEKIKSEKADIETIKKLRKDGDIHFFGPNVLSICQRADAVFIALHGGYGESGLVQACFDLNGVTYTGTDYRSSAMSMDKAITKDLFKVYGVPTPSGIRLKKSEIYNNEVPLPCVVKACNEGSSVSVSLVMKEDELEDAIKEAFKYDDEIIIEQYIKGREFSIGVIDNKAYPIIEIMPKSGFYDYSNKYQPGATVEKCPADLDESITKKMQESALKAFKALRLRDYARFDFMMDENNNFYCLEANTLPGMTPTSLLPQEAQAEGIEYPELCEMLIALALRRKNG